MCGIAIEPGTVSLDEGPDPELIDMRRRFWWSMLSLPGARGAGGAGGASGRRRDPSAAAPHGEGHTASGYWLACICSISRVSIALADL